MTRHEASAVVTIPLATVEEALRDVTSWAPFIGGVEQVTKTAHERYVFRVGEGRRARDVPVVVRRDPRTHCVTWRSVHGPRFEGTLRLLPVDQGRTRMNLSLTAHAEGFLENVSEMVAPNRSQATLDLRRMESFLTERATGHG